MKQLGMDTDIKIKSQSRNEDHQTISVTTETRLTVGETYELTIPFVGYMLGKQEGLYGFTYPDLSQAGSYKMAAVSRFQPYHARETFPCFDEPHFRASFELRISRMEKYQTFSNSEVNNTLPCVINGWVWDRYKPTPPIPTSLVNIVVVDGYKSEMVENSELSSVRINMWGPQGFMTSETMRSSSDLTAASLKFFQDYFDFPYPLPKLDSVMMFQTFGPAIEHWGTILYSMAGGGLLQIPGVTPEWKRFNVISLVAHEVLHQWMGNLVTASWWSDIWLHEGFAEFFCDVFLATAQPEFQSEMIFHNSHAQQAFRFDQSLRAHPVKHNFTMSRRRGEQSDDSDVFDEAIYSKGAVLVRMMRNFLSEPIFKEGMRSFFKKYAYQSVTQTDLFSTFDSVAKDLPTTVLDIMNTWTLQEGFPIVRAMYQAENLVKITQEPFQGAKGNANAKWWIPLTVSSSEHPTANGSLQVWMSEAELTASIQSSKWYILNSDAGAYFRVLYDEANLKKIKIQLDEDHKVLSPLTRSQLLDDYFTFAEFKYIRIEEALSLTSYLHKEKDLVVWTSVFAHLMVPIQMFSGSSTLTGLQKYLVPKLEAVLTSPEFGLEDSSMRKGAAMLLQLELLKTACNLGSRLCAEFALKSLETWKGTPEINPITPDLRPTVYCSGVAEGDKEMWEFIKRMHDMTPPSEEKMSLFKALTCSKDLEILKIMLEDSWEQDGPQLALQTLEALTDNPLARTMVLNSLKYNMIKLYSGDFVRILSELAEYGIPEEEIAALEKLVEANPDYFKPQQSELKEQIDRLRANAIWIQTMGKEIDSWCLQQTS